MAWRSPRHVSWDSGPRLAYFATGSICLAFLYLRSPPSSSAWRRRELSCSGRSEPTCSWTENVLYDFSGNNGDVGPDQAPSRSGAGQPQYGVVAWVGVAGGAAVRDVGRPVAAEPGRYESDRFQADVAAVRQRRGGHEPGTAVRKACPTRSRYRLPARRRRARRTAPAGRRRAAATRGRRRRRSAVRHRAARSDRPPRLPARGNRPAQPGPAWQTRPPAYHGNG